MFFLLPNISMDIGPKNPVSVWSYPIYCIVLEKLCKEAIDLNKTPLSRKNWRKTAVLTNSNC